MKSLNLLRPALFSRSRPLRRVGGAFALGSLLLLGACGASGPEIPDVLGDMADIVARPPAALGGLCLTDADCIAGVCMTSEFGAPFCTRACDNPQVDCAAGPDAAKGTSLCISYDDRPNQDLPFTGDLSTFCVPLCTNKSACIAANPSWETCEKPSHLGNPLYPNLGNQRVCQSPSFQGKDPVDPVSCNWEKTITPTTASQAQLCRRYCEYLDVCKEIPTADDQSCCEWGCFNRMVIEGKIVDAWNDDVKCYIQTHETYPPVATKNSCNGPVQDCGGVPIDPTPPSAKL